MKIPPRITFSNGLRYICVLALLLSPLFAALSRDEAHAAGLGARSLTLESVTTTGGSKPGGTVNHVFSFVAPNAGGTIGSVKVEYCDKAGTTTAFPNCTRPAGIDTTAVAVNTTGLSGSPTSWSTATAISTDPVNTTVKNGVMVSKGAAAPIGTNQTIKFRLTSIVNPTATNYTFFAWITTYDNINGTGSIIDQGTVNASTANQIQLNGKMPESLIFCTGDVIPLTSGGSPQPDCPNATNNIVYFNKLFDPTDTASATSQMAASTNAGSGYAITVYGSTLQNGGNSIAPITGVAATDSVHNTPQFGLNLVSNTPRGAPHVDDVAAVGANVANASNGTNLKGQASTNYNANEQWLFNSGDQVAASDTSGAGPSDLQLFTVSYIVNVPGSQPAGTYTTTLTYVCTAYF